MDDRLWTDGDTIITLVVVGCVSKSKGGYSHLLVMGLRLDLVGTRELHREPPAPCQVPNRSDSLRSLTHPSVLGSQAGPGALHFCRNGMDGNLH